SIRTVVRYESLRVSVGKRRPIRKGRTCRKIAIETAGEIGIVERLEERQSQSPIEKAVVRLVPVPLETQITSIVALLRVIDTVFGAPIFLYRKSRCVANRGSDHFRHLGLSVGILHR